MWIVDNCEGFLNVHLVYNLALLAPGVGSGIPGAIPGWQERWARLQGLLDQVHSDKQQRKAREEREGGRGDTEERGGRGACGQEEMMGGQGLTTYESGGEGPGIEEEERGERRDRERVLVQRGRGEQGGLRGEGRAGLAGQGMGVGPSEFFRMTPSAGRGREGLRGEALTRGRGGGEAVRGTMGRGSSERSYRQEPRPGARPVRVKREREEESGEEGDEEGEEEGEGEEGREEGEEEDNGIVEVTQETQGREEEEENQGDARELWYTPSFPTGAGPPTAQRGTGREGTRGFGSLRGETREGERVRGHEGGRGFGSLWEGRAEGVRRVESERGLGMPMQRRREGRMERGREGRTEEGGLGDSTALLLGVSAAPRQRQRVSEGRGQAPRFPEEEEEVEEVPIGRESSPGLMDVSGENVPMFAHDDLSMHVVHTPVITYIVRNHAHPV